MSENKKRFENFEIRWKDRVGRPECPYLTRWVFTVFGYSIRLHHWTGSDDQREFEGQKVFHDHPFWFITFVLSGFYWDITPSGVELVRQWTFHYRPAEHRHSVKLASKECWTLLLTGPKVRNFGFYVPGREKLLRPLRFFSRYGHHQCEK